MPKAYENAGVSVEAGYEVVKRIKSHVARTNRPGVVGGIGGFGGLFDLASLGYKEPVLISGTDGVGTKLMVAFKLADKHDTIGIDCVAMCVNDIAAPGRRAVVLPRLHRLRQERPGTCSSRSWPVWPTAVYRPVARWSAAKPPKCRACIRRRRIRSRRILGRRCRKVRHRGRFHHR